MTRQSTVTGSLVLRATATPAALDGQLEGVAEFVPPPTLEHEHGAAAAPAPSSKRTSTRGLGEHAGSLVELQPPGVHLRLPCCPDFPAPPDLEMACIARHLETEFVILPCRQVVRKGARR